MNCVDFESILADYLDGILPEAERAAVEEHAAGCSGCSEFMVDVAGGLQFLSHHNPIQPPGELITRIAYLAPRGPARDPFERQGLLDRLKQRWLLPVLQPRLAMSMAMTILSFAMLVRCTGVQVQRIRPADLSPARVWDGVEDKALRVKDQVVKYYDNLRVVYEIEAHLRDLEDQSSTAPQPSQTPSKSAAAGKDPGDSPADANKQGSKR